MHRRHSEDMVIVCGWAPVPLALSIALVVDWMPRRWAPRSPATIFHVVLPVLSNFPLFLQFTHAGGGLSILAEPKMTALAPGFGGNAHENGRNLFLACANYVYFPPVSKYSVFVCSQCPNLRPPFISFLPPVLSLLLCPTRERGLLLLDYPLITRQCHTALP